MLLKLKFAHRLYVHPVFSVGLFSTQVLNSEIKRFWTARNCGMCDTTDELRIANPRIKLQSSGRRVAALCRQVKKKTVRDN
jgi:hypothetical protein